MPKPRRRSKHKPPLRHRIITFTCLRLMTREERIVTFLYYFEELTYEEIAAALDKDITGVKKTHIQALMKLKLTTTFVENLMTPPS